MGTRETDSTTGGSPMRPDSALRASSRSRRSASREGGTGTKGKVRKLLAPFATLALVSGTALSAQNPAPKKVEIVSVTGCLREQGTDNWMLVAASEPTPSNANAPLKRELPTTTTSGPS